jgi:hypothetical protein
MSSLAAYHSSPLLASIPPFVDEQEKDGGTRRRRIGRFSTSFAGRRMRSKQ